MLSAITMPHFICRKKLIVSAERKIDVRILENVYYQHMIGIIHIDFYMWIFCLQNTNITIFKNLKEK